MVALKSIKSNGWRMDPEVSGLTIIFCQKSEWDLILQCRDSMPTVQGLNAIGREALRALSRVYPEVVVTRLHPCPWLAGDSRCRVHLKMECEQVVHSSASFCPKSERSQRVLPICLSNGCR
jgi:hypothetical protein